MILGFITGSIVCTLSSLDCNHFHLFAQLTILERKKLVEVRTGNKVTRRKLEREWFAVNLCRGTGYLRNSEVFSVNIVRRREIVLDEDNREKYE